MLAKLQPAEHQVQQQFEILRITDLMNERNTAQVRFIRLIVDEVFELETLESNVSSGQSRLGLSFLKRATRLLSIPRLRT